MTISSLLSPNSSQGQSADVVVGSGEAVSLSIEGNGRLVVESKTASGYTTQAELGLQVVQEPLVV